MLPACTGSSRHTTTTLLAVLLTVVPFVLLLAVGLLLYMRMRGHHRTLLGKVPAPRAGTQTTLSECLGLRLMGVKEGSFLGLVCGHWGMWPHMCTRSFGAWCFGMDTS